MFSYQQQFPHVEVIPYASLSQVEQQTVRRTGIGASEIGTILGRNPFQSPYELWEVKTGRRTVEQTEAMRIGSYFEKHFVHYLRDYHLDKPILTNGKNMYRLKRNPICLCTPDRFYWEVGYINPRLIEIKITERWSASKRECARLQTLWQMHVMGILYATVYVLQGTKVLKYAYEYNQHEAEILEVEVGRFWRYVTTDTPPPKTEAPAHKQHGVLPVSPFTASFGNWN
jgi:predicted phage-related endonuclease